ncbi:3'(2'),5'-bisphosphate nucleotidase CysQ [Mesorhizobium sp. NPDC059054]|uniref:3'(2'),5'-bisphosphate nucleotidase CysQ n=1 Tax=Mesorhizobium sp. NPDC059054 TaxID=3346711 RepID=UPI00367CE3CC
MPEVDAAGLTSADKDLALLRDAAREAGAIALRYFGKNPEVWMKGGTSPVSEADYAADTYLRNTLLAARPDYGWLSEETADGPERLKARRVFVVDPIDGTRGFLDGQKFWCVSVAVVEDGKSIAGVLECPAAHETYWATPDTGAFLNGQRVKVRNIPTVAELAGPKALQDLVPQAWQGRLRRTAYIPSLAYRLAMIAKGSLDGTFVKPNAHDWDIAAAELILREAGGRLVDSHGSTPAFGKEKVSHGALAAGSGEMLAMMASVISGHAG